MRPNRKELLKIRNQIEAVPVFNIGGDFYLFDENAEFFAAQLDKPYTGGGELKITQADIDEMRVMYRVAVLEPKGVTL